MTKITFSKKFEVKRDEKLDRLTLPYQGKARVSLLKGELEAAYIHNITKVVLHEETGEVVMETRTNQRGEEYQKPAEAFVGRFRCTGDFDTVFEQGTDSQNCVFCKAAEESPAFQRPRRYMVAMVFQYELKPGSGGFQAQVKPFQGKVLPWVFTEGKWNQLAQLDEEFEEDGGVWAMDLMLGPCDSATYQLYDIRAARDCVWRADKDRQEYVNMLLEGYEGDIQTLLGREPKPTEADRVVREVQDTYDAGYNPSGAKSDRLSSSSSAAVDELFSGSGAGDDDDDDTTAIVTSDDPDDDDDSGENKDEAKQVRSIDELINF